jgi:hypothetical protein
MAVKAKNMSTVSFHDKRNWPIITVKINAPAQLPKI